MDSITSISNKMFWKQVDVSLFSLSVTFVLALTSVKILREFSLLMTEATRTNDLVISLSLVTALVLVGLFGQKNQ